MEAGANNPPPLSPGGERRVGPRHILDATRVTAPPEPYLCYATMGPALERGGSSAEEREIGDIELDKRYRGRSFQGIH